MRKPLVYSAALVGLASAGCYEEPAPTCNDSVVTHIAPAVDFAAIQTFAVATDDHLDDALPSDLPPDSVANLREVTNAARAELLALGFTEVDPDVEEPDVWFFNVAVTDEEYGTEWQCQGGYVWWGWYWYWDPCAWVIEVPVEYEVGTVYLGLADVVNEQVVFGGAMSGMLECGDTEARIEAGVHEIFEVYPDPN